MRQEWTNFREGNWCREIDVRDFIQRNYPSGLPRVRAEGVAGSGADAAVVDGAQARSLQS